jgi:hypothetical protein
MPDGSGYQTLPFYGETELKADDFDVEGLSGFRCENSLKNFPDDEISRVFGASIDQWTAGDLTFRVFSPPRSIPDGDSDVTRDALTPAVLVELTVDNRACERNRRAFFGYAGSDRTYGMRILNEPGLVGVGQGTTIAIASSDPGVYAGLAWQAEAILSPKSQTNLGFMLGSLGLLVGTVPAGVKQTFRFAVAFFREGTATSGIRTRYRYRRWFNRVEDVLKHALAQADQTIQLSEAFDLQLANRLSKDRAFMVGHAIRSYYGSTQMLETDDGKPLWVVNEGEYRMMNTFDLTVDQTFFELIMNPWTVRNVLDQFVDRYSYSESARFPASNAVHPGGIAFTHDMGVSNNFAPAGHSGYEQSGLTGCFSYMSSEELLNWVLTAGLYVLDTKDFDWAQGKRKVWLACLSSLENRDHPEPEMRNGVMGLDDARCQGGAEITTYDSLDTSLGQARNNLYMAVKGWASYLLLERIFVQLAEPEAAERAHDQARRAATTIEAAKDAGGMLPAVIGEGVQARIIPAIEALVYPYVMGIDAPFPELIDTLATHFQSVLQPGICLFPDGGWKLSSTSRNSWLSKIYLCQYVSEQILGNPKDVAADQAHVAWLLDPENIFYAWSDQMLDGKAVGSRYYPRGVTSILWLANSDKPLDEIRSLFT